jgi:fermentation-respiration switch protein FrsA (DUF1100 family)
MIWWWIIFIILLLLVIAIYSISVFGYRRIAKKKKMTADECFQILERRGLYTRNQFNQLKKQEIVIQNKAGLKLHGYYIEANPSSKKLLILLHGYTSAYSMSMQFAELYIQQGFNLLAIDHRAHGESEGIFTSYGYYEKHDIDDWIAWVREQIGSDIFIGLHGISLGSGTALEYLRINQYAKFIIADCPYSDLAELIRYQIRYLYKAPTFIFYYTIGFLVQLFARFRFSYVRPITAVAESELPILFIHGNKDRFIPTYMSQHLYAAKQKGIKQLLIVDGAGHSDSYIRNREQYEEKVSSFLQEVLKDHNSTRA